MPHIHELYDFVTSVYIVHDSKVLLVNHPRYGKWIPIGGHVELDETPEDALYREIEEETGLKVKILNNEPVLNSHIDGFITTPRFMHVHPANPPHQHIALIYFAKSQNDKFIKSDEHTEGRWFSDKELDNPKYNISEQVKFTAREALKAATII